MSGVVMTCTTHGAVVPEAEVIQDDDQRVIEWRCPECGERLGEFLDGGNLNLTRLPEDRPTNDFQFFFETWEGVVQTGSFHLEGEDALRAMGNPLWLREALGFEMSRRQRIRRHFRTKLSIRPTWKRCVPISCPDVGEHYINWTSDPHR